MNAKTRPLRSSTEVKLERRSNFRTRILNQISTWLSHEVCFGVYTNRMRWLGSDRNAARLGCDFSPPCLPLTPNSSWTPQVWATHTTRLSDWCVFRLSTMNPQPAQGSVATVCCTCARKSASVRVGPSVGAITQPHQISRLAVRHSVPWRWYSYSRR